MTVSLLHCSVTCTEWPAAWCCHRALCSHVCLVYTYSVLVDASLSCRTCGILGGSTIPNNPRVVWSPHYTTVSLPFLSPVYRQCLTPCWYTTPTATPAGRGLEHDPLVMWGEWLCCTCCCHERVYYMERKKYVWYKFPKLLVASGNVEFMVLAFSNVTVV